MTVIELVNAMYHATQCQALGDLVACVSCNFKWSKRLESVGLAMALSLLPELQYQCTLHIIWAYIAIIAAIMKVRCNACTSTTHLEFETH